MRLTKTIPRKDKSSKCLRVLVPVDFTPESLSALRYAGILAGRFGSRIHLLHVLRVAETHPWAVGDGAIILMKSDEESAREAKKQLSRLATEELSAELPVRLLVRRGQPAAEILRAAKALRADLVILAAHPCSVLGRLLLGSTVSRVERQAPCPLLILRNHDDASMETTLWRETDGDTGRLRPGPATRGLP